MKRIILIILLFIPLMASADYLYTEFQAGYEEYHNNYYSIFTIGYTGRYFNIYTGIDTIVNKHEDTRLTFYPVLTTYFICGEIKIINGANIITTFGVYHSCSHLSEEGYRERYYWLPTMTRYYGKIIFRTH